MNHRSSWVLSAIVCLAISGCSDQPQTGDSERADEGLAESKPTDGTGGSSTEQTARENLHHYFHTEEQRFEAKWSYEGQSGPSHWGDLSDSYSLAEEGKRQSPIDIDETEELDLMPLEFEYRPSKIHIVYNGHAIQQNEDAGSYLKLGDQKFRLHQFHFHAPSEHTIHGKHFALEMHLVHKDDAGRIAVVALMFEEGDANEWLGPVWKLLPTQENRQREIDVEFDIVGILPSDLSYYEYSGSLTTPPCTEDVQWFVMQAPQSISASQLAAFTSVIDHNNRPTQPLNGRTVEASH